MDGQMRDELTDFVFRQVYRVTFVVKENKAPDSTNVRTFSG